MAQLHTVLAIEKTAKSEGAGALTTAYHLLQKGPLLSGIARTYRPRDDGDTGLPAESTQVQIRTDDVIAGVTDKLTRMFDVMATKEATNTKAFADIVIDGTVLIPNVPVTVLLFLEKQVADLVTFVRKLPILDPAEIWTYNPTSNSYATAPIDSVKTKKIPRNHELAPATDKHAAQVQLYHEDVIAGTWTTTKFSGALPASRIAELLERVETLQRAVKVARQNANSTEVLDVKIGRTIFGYLFA